MHQKSSTVNAGTLQGTSASLPNTTIRGNTGAVLDIEQVIGTGTYSAAITNNGAGQNFAVAINQQGDLDALSLQEQIPILPEQQFIREAFQAQRRLFKEILPRMQEPLLILIKIQTEPILKFFQEQALSILTIKGARERSRLTPLIPILVQQPLRMDL